MNIQHCLLMVVAVLSPGAAHSLTQDSESPGPGPAAESTPEPARALEDRGLGNLRAFVRLFGYVRHFHPSDEAVEADWEQLAIAGVRAVEAARDAGELAETLEGLFRPVAPTLRVYPTGQVPDPPTALSIPESAGRVYVRTWRHVGFGQERSAYTSTRLKKSVRGGELPEGIPDPAAPFLALLEGGVTCAVPIALYANSEGTLPHTPKEKRPIGAAFSRSDDDSPSGNDRATRLAAVVIGWNIFQHFYPYFDVVETDWSAELDRALTAAATDPDERAFLDTLRRMIAALHDGHGNVWHASDQARHTLPITWDWIEERVVVTHSVATGTGPAPGDVVVELDGQPIETALAQTEELISGATPWWRRGRALDRLLKSDTTAPRKLAYLSLLDDDERIEVELRPGSGVVTASDYLPEKIAELEPGIWYVDLDRVNDAEFEATLPSLTQATGIVFDLRGYPRALSPNTFFPHLVSEASTSPQWHFPLVTRPDREALDFLRQGEWTILPEEPFLEARRVFLIGPGAISYAESCMGIVEHYALADIIGATTAGTNGNVNPLQLPGGYQVAWTGMKVLKHDGSRHHGVGIRPTMPVERTRVAALEERDEVLEQALEVLRR